MKYEKYLPLGTVVILKGGKHRIMVTGFCCTAKEDTSKTYDYVGCLYPEGYISADKNILFDHEQIDKFYYMGLSDNEEKVDATVFTSDG